MDYIKLENMRFRAHHGCLPEERKTGTEFLLTLTMGGDFRREARHDTLFDDSLNYADVYRRVKEEMKQPSRIIENVALRVLESVWNAYPALTYLKVELSKLHPPLTGEIGAATVVMEKFRKRD